MRGEFLPEWHYLPLEGMYRPLWRLWTGEPWKQLSVDHKPVRCVTAAQAISTAKAHVQGILNPPIRAERAATIDPLGLDAWNEQRSAQAGNAAMLALGGIIHKQRIIPVERRRARA